MNKYHICKMGWHGLSLCGLLVESNDICQWSWHRDKKQYVYSFEKVVVETVHEDNVCKNCKKILLKRGNPYG